MQSSDLKAIKRLTAKKAYKHMVQEVHSDTECFEVVLFENYRNRNFDETMWTFGYHNRTWQDGDMTQKDMLEDLELWLGAVKQK